MRDRLENNKVGNPRDAQISRPDFWMDLHPSLLWECWSSISSYSEHSKYRSTRDDSLPSGPAGYSSHFEMKLRIGAHSACPHWSDLQFFWVAIVLGRCLIFLERAKSPFDRVGVEQEPQRLCMSYATPHVPIPLLLIVPARPRGGDSVQLVPKTVVHSEKSHWSTHPKLGATI